MLKFGADQTEKEDGKLRLVSSANVSPIDLHLQTEYVNFTKDIIEWFASKIEQKCETEPVSSYPPFIYNPANKI